MADIILDDVSKEDYEKSGSKFPTGGYHAVEFGILDQDTPGVSVKLPLTITEKGEDEGKEDKISFGIKSNAIWKLKDTLKRFGIDLPFVDTSKGKRPVITEAIINKLAGAKGVGHWVMQKDSRTEADGGTGKSYAKLADIYPEGYVATEEEIM